MCLAELKKISSGVDALRHVAEYDLEEAASLLESLDSKRQLKQELRDI